jgi:hypothetical protein
MNKTYRKVKKIREENIQAILNNPGEMLEMIEYLEEVGQYSQSSINFITKKNKQESKVSQ